jgi:hypothetical protein
MACAKPPYFRSGIAVIGRERAVARVEPLS